MLLAVVDNAALEPTGSLPVRILFETPIASGVLGLAAGLLAWFMLRQSDKGTLATLALGAGVLLGGLGAAVGTVVQTDREKISTATKAFVDAVATGDTAAAGTLLAPSLSVTSGGASTSLDSGTIVGAIDRFHGMISSHSSTAKGARVEGTNIGRSRVSVGVTFLGSSYGGSVGSQWELGWRRVTDGTWKITSVDCLAILNRAPGSSWVSEVQRLAR